MPLMPNLKPAQRIGALVDYLKANRDAFPPASLKYLDFIIAHLQKGADFWSDYGRYVYLPEGIGNAPEDFYTVCQVMLANTEDYYRRINPAWGYDPQLSQSDEAFQWCNSMVKPLFFLRARVSGTEAESIRFFLSDERRKLISVKQIEELANVPPTTLRNFLNRVRGLPPQHIPAIISVLKTVGYSPIEG